MKRTLRSWRVDRGLTQVQLAEKAGVSAQSIVKWEKDISTATVKHLAKVAEVLGISIDDIILS